MMKVLVDWMPESDWGIISILCEVLELLSVVLVESDSGCTFDLNGQVIARVEYSVDVIYYDSHIDGHGGEDYVYEARLFIEESFLAKYARVILEIAKPRLARALFNHGNWPTKKSWIEPSTEAAWYLERAEEDLREVLG